MGRPMTKTYEDAHDELCSIMKDYGLGDGSRGWIESHNPISNTVSRDPLTFEGELMCAFEALLQRSNKL